MADEDQAPNGMTLEEWRKKQKVIVDPRTYNIFLIIE